MTNNDELALKSEERIKAIANGAQMLMGESRQLAAAALYWKEQVRIATDAFQQSGIMQVKAEDKSEVLLAERDADKKRIAEMNDTLDRECEKSRRMASRISELEALTAEQDKRLLSYAAIATKNAEARTVSVKLPDDEDGQPFGFGKWANSKLPATTGTMTISRCEDSWRAALYVFAAAAGVKLEVGE